MRAGIPIRTQRRRLHVGRTRARRSRIDGPDPWRGLGDPMVFFTMGAAGALVMLTTRPVGFGGHAPRRRGEVASARVVSFSWRTIASTLVSSPPLDATFSTLAGGGMHVRKRPCIHMKPTRCANTQSRLTRPAFTARERQARRHKEVGGKGGASAATHHDHGRGRSKQRARWSTWQR